MQILPIDFKGRHAAVFGTTQSGKTTASEISLRNVLPGVLYFNPQHIVLKGYTRADKSHDAQDILSALRAGEKIDYRPARDTRWRELTYLIDAVYKSANQYGKLECYIAIDECHLMSLDPDKDKKAALAAAQEIATTGLTWGIKGVYITQRPALLNNTLMTQCETKVFFRTEMEGPYLKNYGIPHEQLVAALNAGGDYAYCIYYRGEVSEPMKVK